MSDADDPDPDDSLRDVVRVGDDDADGDAADDGEAADDGPPVGREGVMDPDELDIRDREAVDRTADGRYVISTGDGRRDDDPPRSPDPSAGPDGEGAVDADGSPATTDGSDAATAGSPAPHDSETPGRPVDGPDDPPEAVADELGGLSSSHGLALAVAAGGETDTLRVASADPPDTLATVLRWYARRIDPEESPEATIADLLGASDLDVG